MNIPGANLVNSAQDKARATENQVNRVDVPMTRRLGLADFVKELFKQMGKDHTGAFAGNLAYNALFSIFPFLLFLVSLLGIFHATSLINTMIERAATTMPTDAVHVVRRIAASVTHTQATGTFTVGAVIAVLAALWGASGGFRAVMEAMNVMYDVEDRRPFWKKYLTSIILALAVAGLLISALVLLVFGPRIGGALASAAGLGAAFTWTWNIVQWPILIGFVLLAFALVYYFAPDVEQEFRFISPGAVAGVALWLVFSLLFSLYVNNFGSYNKVYGALAGIVIFLLYLYYSAYILLLGAEINQIIEKHAPDGKKGGERRAGKSAADAQHIEMDSRTLTILKENRPRT